MTTHTRASAAQSVASTFGVMVGLAGILHGSFETLQGMLARDVEESPAKGVQIHG